MKENWSCGAEILYNETYDVNLPDTGFETKFQQQSEDLTCKEGFEERRGLENLLQESVGSLRPVANGVDVEHDYLSEHVFMSLSGANSSLLTPLTQTCDEPSLVEVEHTFALISAESLPTDQMHELMCKRSISTLMESCSSSECEHILKSPLPNLPWINSDEFWHMMRLKDTSEMAPEAKLRDRHPEVLPSMRVILLDWLMEVSAPQIG